MTIGEYEFDERLRFSNGVLIGADVRRIFTEAIPGVVDVVRASENDDRRGADWFASMKDGRVLAIDVKVRDVDYAARGEDDLALETHSVLRCRCLNEEFLLMTPAELAQVAKCSSNSVIDALEPRVGAAGRVNGIGFFWKSASPGWTRDDRKCTDYILWLWKDTGRWCLLPFPMLCGAFIDHWKKWSAMYKRRQQTTKAEGQQSWQSECIFVPREVVWSAILKKYAGGPSMAMVAAA
jgi:hypothetical protein